MADPSEKEYRSGGAMRCCIHHLLIAGLPEKVEVGYQIKCICGDGMFWNGDCWVSKVTYDKEKENGK